jgi:hypothetical protein
MTDARLIFITGFPRSGTSYLHDALLAHPECTGPRYESAAPYLWRMRGTSVQAVREIAESARSSALPPPAYDLFHVGQYMAFAAGADVVDLLDRMLAPADGGPRNVVVKTPLFQWIPGWPMEYVRESRVFGAYQVLACVRHPKDIYESMRRHFWTWDQPFYQFLAECQAFYTALNREPHTRVSHRVMSAITDGHLRAIGQRLGLAAPLRPHEPFKATQPEAKP